MHFLVQVHQLLSVSTGGACKQHVSISALESREGIIYVLASRWVQQISGSWAQHKFCKASPRQDISRLPVNCNPQLLTGEWDQWCLWLDFGHGCQFGLCRCASVCLATSTTQSCPLAYRYNISASEVMLWRNSVAWYRKRGKVYGLAAALAAK